MKKILSTLFCLTWISSSFALGPSELTFNGIHFSKNGEKKQNNVIVADYEATDSSGASITLTHVLDKNDPGQIADSLKQKKSIEVMDIEKLTADSSDVLVTFVKFDTDNLKVENNLCRIFKNPGQNGSIVFQYIDTKKLKNQAEGATIPDFTQLAANMKQLQISQYTVATYAQARPDYEERYGRPSNRYTRGSYQSQGNVPWYKRPGARAGADAYQSNRRYR